jgi:transcriptional regulator with XRE-family HTH domain
MGRAALRWSAADLAKAAGVGYATIARFETGQPVTPETVATVRAALEAGGVEFIPAGATLRMGGGSAGAGVRLKGEGSRG